MRRAGSFLTVLSLMALCCVPSPVFAQSESIGVENPYRSLSLEQYLDQKDIGTLNKDGIWEYKLPESWSGDSDVGNLIYGLELYGNYADAYNQSLDDLEIKGMRYRSWSFTKDEIQTYYKKMPDTFAQIKLLIQFLDRPSSEDIGNGDTPPEG